MQRGNGRKRGHCTMRCPSLSPHTHFGIANFLLFYSQVQFKHRLILMPPKSICESYIVFLLQNCECLAGHSEKFTNNMMKKIQQLKKLLEKDDSEKGVQSFKEILEEKGPDGAGIHVEDLNLLLRWAVTEQKKHFPKFHEILIKMGASVNFIDTRQKKSNLMIACERSNIEIVETLVNTEGTNFGLEDSRKKNALYYCIDNKNKEKGEKYIRLILLKCPQLLSNESNTNSIPLVAAIEKGRIEIIRALLELGADPNAKVADNGNTPLHEAIKMWKSKPSQANQQIVQTLLENGADPSIKNRQNKNALEMAEKLQQELLVMVEKASPSTVPPILKINTPEQREAIFDQAAAIFKANEHLIEQPHLSSDSESQEIIEEAQEGIQIYEQPRMFMETLSMEIHSFAQDCMIDWENAQDELSRFLKELQIITEGLSLSPYVYGSFATRLWLKHCDIDLLLIPGNQSPIESIEWYLDEIYRRLKRTKNYNRASILKSIKVPMIRIQVQDGQQKRKNPRKFDITVMGINHNGKHHVMYITNLLRSFPVLQPLFYVVKKLSYYYKLNDPKNFGVRSYALVLMLALFLNDYPNHSSLGELLLSFFYKFGYSYEYQYRHNTSEQESMVLNLPDPINPKNNVGSQTDACSLQRMFKTAYIILHTRGPESKLNYLFDSRNIFSLRDGA